MWCEQCSEGKGSCRVPHHHQQPCEGVHPHRQLGSAGFTSPHSPQVLLAGCSEVLGDGPNLCPACTMCWQPVVLARSQHFQDLSFPMFSSPMAKPGDSSVEGAQGAAGCWDLLCVGNGKLFPSGKGVAQLVVYFCLPYNPAF